MFKFIWLATISIYFHLNLHNNANNVSKKLDWRRSELMNIFGFSVSLCRLNRSNTSSSISSPFARSHLNLCPNLIIFQDPIQKSVTFFLILQDHEVFTGINLHHFNRKLVEPSCSKRSHTLQLSSSDNMYSKKGQAIQLSAVGRKYYLHLEDQDELNK